MNAKPHVPENAPRPEPGRPTKTEVLAILQPLSEQEVGAFGLILDAELSRLEERFASFVTHKSVQISFGR